MLKESTINKYRNILNNIKETGLSVSAFFQELGESPTTFFSTMAKIKKEAEEGVESLKELVDLYNSIISKDKNFRLEKATEEVVDSENFVETKYIRNSEGKIIEYSYIIYKKDKPALSGTLTREEMSKMIRAYTYAGDGFTARTVSRDFPQFSLQDLKRVFRAFSIYKDNCPFAPHDVEEKTEDELRAMQLREKENSFMRKAEEDNIRNNEKLLRKYAQENIALKKQLSTFKDINLNINNLEPYCIKTVDSETTSAINIYLSDIHLGAAVETGSLYDENTSYNEDEVKRRLESVIEKLYELGTFNVVNICLMGDNIDCCGFKGFTASMTHQMPENMDPRDQFNKFIKIYDWFIRSIIETGLGESIRVFSVPTGNHGGNFEFALNNTLKYYTEARFPGITFTLFDKFFGVFKQNEVTFCLTHGKNDQFMKKGMPLNLDDKNKVKIYEWLDDNQLYGDNIHIIKGDLHSNNINSCKRFTYRNVLSLFGASDYSSYGFSRNSYGVSYDIIYNSNVLSGTIENV